MNPTERNRAALSVFARLAGGRAAALAALLDPADDSGVLAVNIAAAWNPQDAAAVPVHWFRAGSPLGNPAQCGSQEGRATRVASAVTCPACIAWMVDESWLAVAR